MKELLEVQEYWDKYPIGIEVTDKKWGSKDFFQEYKEYMDKADLLVHSDKILNFSSYKGKSILEIGCGLGIDALKFSRYGANVTAIDLSPKNIELAKKYFTYNNLNADLRVGNAEDLPFKANFFDLVFAIGVFYYTPNTQKAIDETFRVLKPDGKTIAMFYNKYSWYVLLAKVSGTNLDHEEKDPPISKLYSVKQVRKMFKKFSIVDIIMNRFPFKTVKRSGSSVKLYNYAFVPFTKVIPKTIMQPFGFHIIVKATK